MLSGQYILKFLSFDTYGVVVFYMIIKFINATKLHITQLHSLNVVLFSTTILTGTCCFNHVFLYLLRQ
jgi:hypothetical protein